MSAIPVLRRRTRPGVVELRGLRRRDARQWREVRAHNAAWLSPWEATVPPGSDEQIPSFAQMVSRSRTEARAGRTLAWAITLDGHLVGQVTAGGIMLGSLRAASIGYWIDSRVAGLGLAPTAVAMVCDYCFDMLALHRIEIVIRPENTASLRVVAKLGFRHEGTRPGFLHIDGDWRDHEVFALTAPERSGPLVDRLAGRHESSLGGFTPPRDP
jgi:ribosomal-protein-alanine N-acetyltransferase